MVGGPSREQREAEPCREREEVVEGPSTEQRGAEVVALKWAPARWARPTEHEEVVGATWEQCRRAEGPED